MRIAFLGLGLIGGSVARALRAPGSPAAYADAELVAWTPSGDGPRAARADGVLDRIANDPETAIDGADLVVLAGPPRACIDLVGRLGGPWRASLGAVATVTDVASTKAAITAAAERAGIPFVGGHPMAGREVTGFAAADAALFRDRPWVVTESVRGGDSAAVRSLAVACGARPVELDAARHDRLVAAISHLPLLASVALVEAVAGTASVPAADWPDAAALAAGGWRDTTRIAGGDPALWTAIFQANRAEVLAALGRLTGWLDEFRRLLESGDTDGLFRWLSEGKQVRDALGT
ncbi:MAG TPA: prephenate dehydrogenase/arogenate dehydrogenase family protein [Candidatus Limnocylindrales bacterium]|nr:prephenate dehydrogenase/arogenate dehydrogenase family protein [Candidatus Limnocylindrales bacterium]